jgi:hypothetical protein
VRYAVGSTGVVRSGRATTAGTDRLSYGSYNGIRDPDRPPEGVANRVERDADGRLLRILRHEVGDELRRAFGIGSSFRRAQQLQLLPMMIMDAQQTNDVSNGSDLLDEASSPRGSTCRARHSRAGAMPGRARAISRLAD